MSDLYFNEESDYSAVNTCDNKVFCSPILQPFQFDPEQKQTCGNDSHEKEIKHIHGPAADLLHIRIGNLDLCKCGHCKNEARGINCCCSKEVNAMLVALVKISEHERNISLSSFYGKLPDARPLVTSVSLIYLIDEFFFLFPV